MFSLIFIPKVYVGTVNTSKCKRITLIWPIYTFSANKTARQFCNVLMCNDIQFLYLIDIV